MNPWFKELKSLPDSRWHASVLDAIRLEEPATTCLIDNSKKVRWASRFVGNGDFTPYFVHLIRDPRALVSRWMRTYDTERAKRRQRMRIMKARPAYAYAYAALTGSEADVYCYKWLIANRQITDFLARVGQSTNVVTYSGAQSA